MSAIDRQTHLYWYPGGTWASVGVDANYVGTIMSGRGSVPTVSPAISWQNGKRAVCDGKYAQFVEGKGHSTSRSYPLGFASNQFRMAQGYVYQTGYGPNHLGLAVWFETTTNIATSDYCGKYIVFEDGSMNQLNELIIPEIQQPGTSLYTIVLVDNYARNGYARISNVGDAYQLESAWEDRMYALVSSSIGLLEVVRAVRDADTGVLSSVLYTEYYRAAAKGSKLTSSYGMTLPWVTFDLDVDQVRIASAEAY